VAIKESMAKKANPRVKPKLSMRYPVTGKAAVEIIKPPPLTAPTEVPILSPRVSSAEKARPTGKVAKMQKPIPSRSRVSQRE